MTGDRKKGRKYDEKGMIRCFLCVLILVFCAACGKTDEEDGTIKKITASTTSYEHFENPLAEQYSVLAM